jgi:hypothetical protein
VDLEAKFKELKERKLRNDRRSGKRTQVVEIQLFVMRLSAGFLPPLRAALPQRARPTLLTSTALPDAGELFFDQTHSKI